MKKNEKKTYTREEIDALRQNIGKNLWIKGTLLNPQLDLGMARCTGVKIETADFRFAEISYGLRLGEAGQIRSREQTFLTESEMQNFLIEWAKEIQTTVGYHWVAILRENCRIIITPIRVSEDEWTGKQSLELRTENKDNEPKEKRQLCEEDLLSLGYKLVKSTKYSDLVNAVLEVCKYAEHCASRQAKGSM